MPQAGIEPTTLALGVLCSVHLSYWGLDRIIAFHADFRNMKKGEVGIPLLFLILSVGLFPAVLVYCGGVTEK